MKEYRNDKGKLHRIDGPACEYASGDKTWWQYGKLHRLDGPAIEFADGDKYWYIDDVEYTEEEFKAKTKGERIMQEYTVKVDDNGDKWWYQNGELHRIDGPAWEQASGGKLWYQDGKRHRLDGPAIERADGGKWWYQDDKLHRIDGPAVEWANGAKVWCIEGVHYTENEFNTRTKAPRKVTMQEVIDQFGENVVITKEST